VLDGSTPRAALGSRPLGLSDRVQVDDLIEKLRPQVSQPVPQFLDQFLQRALGEDLSIDVAGQPHRGQGRMPILGHLLCGRERLEHQGGRWMDNVFTERLWRSLKYECVFLNAFETGGEAKTGIEWWIGYYNGASQHPFVYVIEENRLC
jgi:Integrase core domain